jgi:hypothetical protein
VKIAVGAYPANWLDDDGGLAIDDMARRLGSFIDAMADGKVTDGELSAQEDRVTDLMREIEPQLDDALHARLTVLLCELSAFDIMQMLHTVQAARPQTTFRG